MSLALVALWPQKVCARVLGEVANRSTRQATVVAFIFPSSCLLVSSSSRLFAFVFALRRVVCHYNCIVNFIQSTHHVIHLQRRRMCRSGGHARGSCVLTGSERTWTKRCSEARPEKIPPKSRTRGRGGGAGGARCRLPLHYYCKHTDRAGCWCLVDPTTPLATKKS